jgi:hypothetical protein
MRSIHRALSGKVQCAPIVSLFYLLALFVACHGSQHHDSMRNMLPRETEIPGWGIMENSVRYTTDIAEYFGGDVERYKNYGLEELIVAKYRTIHDHSILTVEIFHMSSALNAFGIFSFERGFSGDESGLEWTAFLSARGLFFIRESYYIRLKIDNRENRFKRELLMIAGIIYERIFRGGSGLPEYIGLFNSKNYLNNLIYYRGAYPELPLLKNIFLRKKQVRDREYLVFFKRSDSTSRALRIFDRLINNKKQPFIATEYGRIKIAFHRESIERHIFISQYREWLFGVLYADDIREGRDIIMILYRELLGFIRGH